jgi:membrane protease YdiL (CAAX protease family)
MSNDSSSSRKSNTPTGQGFLYTPDPVVPEHDSALIKLTGFKAARQAKAKAKAARKRQAAAEAAAQKAAAKTVTWGPLAAVLYALVVYFVAQMGGSVLVILYPHLRGWDKATGSNWLDTSIVAQFWFVLLTEAMTFGAIWWFIRAKGSALRQIGWRWPRFRDPMYAFCGFAAYFAGYVLLLGLVSHIFPGINVDQKQQLGFENPATDTSLLLTFVSLVVLPPLVEETVFRGFVYSGLKTKLKPIVAALATSALFAMAHLEFGSGKPLLWVAGIDTFTLSLVLCYLREKTDSLWPGILLHALKNSIAFVSLFLIAN